MKPPVAVLTVRMRVEADEGYVDEEMLSRVRDMLMEDYAQAGLLDVEVLSAEMEEPDTGGMLE